MDGLFIGKKVIVRTYSAGVHFGELAYRSGREVLLKNSRRIWQWSGAFTLSAVSQDGVADARLSRSVPSIILTEAIEIIPCSALAAKQLAEMQEHGL